MPSNDRQTVILPVKLGPARSYDRTIFPLARFKGMGPLREGDLLLRATMNEMYNIRDMAKGLDSSRELELLRDAKQRYDGLVEERVKLGESEEEKLYNPLKVYSRFRATRIFLRASRRLYTATWTTSEKMRRAHLSVVSLVATPAPEEPIAEDEQIEGIAVDIDGPVNQQTASVLAEMQGMFEVSRNPSAEANPSDGEEVATSQAMESTTDPETLSSVQSSVPSPTSPRSAGISFSNFHYHNYNAGVHNYNPTASSGFSVNNGISNDNSIHHHMPPSDPLP
ncbi:hypothetical protein PAXRUDRAFT_833306 [Paxillus rubicundulus Ve08.2h10]|uniref:Uncharacterized protein n=1 Tax=Paxillus rubicundulus Ve08.2h10 TaxID=930991 RepID=A0A0D0DAA5_9AGAM|nr:hypothetical protein PAXRUDRAFT_833306 [Paxillus rubicundulus Ve08.2h10]